MKSPFLKTSDEETANALLSLGFKLISEDGSIKTFMNNTAITFDDKKLKVAYSNMLTM